MPWDSFWQFPAEAWRLREAWPEVTSSIRDCELSPEVCPDHPLWMLLIVTLLSLVLYYTHTLWCLQRCQQFWNAPRKVSTSIFRGDGFPLLCEGVEECSGRVLEADIFERALREIYEDWAGWRCWEWEVWVCSIFSTGFVACLDRSSGGEHCCSFKLTF